MTMRSYSMVSAMVKVIAIETEKRRGRRHFGQTQSQASHRPFWIFSVRKREPFIRGAKSAGVFQRSNSHELFEVERFYMSITSSGFTRCTGFGRTGVGPALGGTAF